MSAVIERRFRDTQIVTFHTGGRYQHECNRWWSSLQQAGVPCGHGGFMAAQVPDRGHWALNNQQKVGFIRDCLRIYRRPVMWIDADCLVWSDPRIALANDFGEESPADLLYATLDDENGIPQLFASTLWFANNARVHSLLNEWENTLPCEEEVRGLDEFQLPRSEQGVLADLLKQWDSDDRDFNHGQLPRKYAHLFEWRSVDRAENGPIVIEAFQFSRVAKKELLNAGSDRHLPHE